MKNLSRKQIVLFTIIYFAGMLLLVLSITNLFTESIFQGKYLALYFLIIGATLTMLKIHLSYWKPKIKVSE